MADKAFSTYKVAKFCNVHHTTVINWVNIGKLKAYTTPGGHRRIKREDLIKFAKKYEIPLPKQINRERERVLIVDDDAEALEELRDALSGHGFDLEFASDGFEAARSIYRGRPDLVLLDFKMPGMDGFQVCDFLRKDEETADISIIAVTVLKSDEDVRKIREYGVNDYIPKPVDVDKLLAAIRGQLNIEEKEQEEVKK